MRTPNLLATLTAIVALSTSFAAGRGAVPALPEAREATTETLRVPGTRTLSIAADERATLRAAEAGASGLEEMRGGELTLSDNDVKLILITTAVVILLILIF